MLRPKKYLKKTRIKQYNTLELPALLYSSDKWTFKTRDTRRITAAETKCMRKRAGYTWTEYKPSTQIAKQLNTTPFLVRIQEYRRKCLQHTNRMPLNGLLRIRKKVQTNR